MSSLLAADLMPPGPGTLSDLVPAMGQALTGGGPAGLATAATVGEAISREMVHRLTAEKAALTQLRLGSEIGEEPMRPLSFPKATTEPVVVTPPR